MIERICRDNHERCQKGHARRVLDHLADKGILERYIGDFTFQSDETLPTESEIIEKTKQAMKQVGFK